MQWRGRRQSNNIEDRRGSGMKTGGLSIGSIILALVLWRVFGISPETTLGVAQQVGQVNEQSAPINETANQVESREFVATVLADTEDVWIPIFASFGDTYQPPTLVMFKGSVKSACGMAMSASGPFYCPSDQKVYLDTQFFVDMRRHMNVSGERNGSTELSFNDQVGDFAQAYVIAHEVGHHVQTLLGISQEVRRAQMQATKRQANELSVRQELQADCFAGMWAKKNHERTGFLQQGDIEEALDAAKKIGDDYLQHKSHGHVIPDSFTHGTSVQRQYWFYRGFKTGDIQACDTFGVNQL